MRPQRSRGGRPHFPALLLLMVTLSACGGIAAPPAAPSASPPTMTPPPPTATGAPVGAEAEPCAGGRLTVGDLPEIDAAWGAGIAAATETARLWQEDARLVRLRVGCQPLESDFRWQGTFYSDAAQSFFLSDTGQTEPAEVDPADVPTLPLDRISFRELYRSLARAGHEDGDELSATNGVTIRLNAPEDPFGPPGIPRDIVYHVAVDDQGEVRDIFVSGADWIIYSYGDGR